MYIDSVNIIEVVLKEELEIPLTEEERKCLEDLDEDIKQVIVEYMNDESYCDEAIKILSRIISDIHNYPVENQEKILKNCTNKIDSLKNNQRKTM